ncbi:MutT/nudix family protein [Streptococcus pneumoniae]|nr:MutT/nudix family protein [Streptococcus pneumoniae]ARD36661.1 MutT/nudix family protein [Streptococcus pneumoniae]
MQWQTQLSEKKSEYRLYCSLWRICSYP